MAPSAAMAAPVGSSSRGGAPRPWREVIYLGIVFFYGLGAITMVEFSWGGFSNENNDALIG